MTPIPAALVSYSLSLFYSGAPHSCGFFISTLFSTSPIHLVSLHCYTFAPFSGVSPSCTSFHFHSFLHFSHPSRLIALLYFCTFLWCFLFLHLFSFPLFSPLLPSISSHCIAILLHLSLVFPLPAPLFISFCSQFYSAISNCYIPYNFFILSTVTLVCPFPKPGFTILLPSSPGSNFTLQQPDWFFYLPENKSPPTSSSIQ